MNIVFICMGNICRSPLAEGIAKHIYKGSKLHFSSAGTSGFHNGDIIDERSISVAKKYGIDISTYTSKQVGIHTSSEVDLFVAMDRRNVEALLQMRFEDKKIKLLGDFGLGGAEVKDPYYGSINDFNEVYLLLNKGIANLIKELDNE